MVVLVPPEVLALPPSREDGIDEEAEEQLRRFGVALLQRAGHLLRLPQLTVASAAALLQRFYFRRSFSEFELRAVASAALALAAKLQEHPRKIVEVIQVFYRLRMRELKEEDGSFSYEGKPTPQLDPTKKEYADAKKELLSAERNILRELGFEVALLLDLPQRYALEYVEQLQRPPGLAQQVWNYVNDLLQTSLCCSCQPNVLAGASLLLAARDLQLQLPSKPAWWQTFGLPIQECEQVAAEVLELYKGEVPEYLEVPRRKREELFAPHTPMMTPPPMVKSPSDEEDFPEDGLALTRQDSGLDPQRVAEIIAESEANGTGFTGVPSSGDQDAQAEPKPDIKADAKGDATDAKPDAKADAKSDAKMESKRKERRKEKKRNSSESPKRKEPEKAEARRARRSKRSASSSDSTRLKKKKSK
ncbi:unnamed protein product [Effrenium voratum]|nr:unnamed protein product [Effrenium voratum]